MGIWELLGALTGVAGAVLMASKCRYAGWAFPLWIVSGIAWGVFAISSETYGLVAQQVVFTAINIFGAYRWLAKPLLSLRGRPADSTPQ